MELKRFNMVYNDFYESNEMEYDADSGDYVEWTPKLQEALDKQQEVEVNDKHFVETLYGSYNEERAYCPRCGEYMMDSEYKYCPNCGQKIKW